MLLRNVELGDVDTYVRMRCDPVMMAELGGPLPREGIEAKVARDVAGVERDESWVKMIVPDEDRPEAVAGNVMLWLHDEGGAQFSEIGWMVLPEFQGRGIASRATAAVLDLARADGRWGLVHAFPGATNAASNGVCRKLGFALLGQAEVEFAGRMLKTNHWAIQT